VYTPETFGDKFTLKKGDIVVDLGAHIGVFTIFASKRGAFVYSFEPMPENFRLLKENIRLNRLNNKVKAFQLAISSKKGFSSLYIWDLGLSSLNFQSGKSLTVETVRLEDILDLIESDRIDFLKVDVEGAEWNIFKVAKRSLTKIKKIAMECHSAKNALRLKRLFKASGFQVQISPGGHPTLAYIYAKRD
jgi:FkbM family methyltransferase